jgi:hypothetical protein
MGGSCSTNGGRGMRIDYSCESQRESGLSSSAQLHRDS